MRRVFFSFHYQRDVRRIQQVRNSWVVRSEGEAQPFYDAADFEEATRRAGGIQKWIDDQLRGCSVTAVLYGRETFERKWVKYEIEQSDKKKMGILAIAIHGIRDPVNGNDLPGRNPLEHWRVDNTSFTQKYKSYDWVRDDGYNNIGTWIERAAREAGR